MEFVPVPDVDVADEHLGLGDDYRPRHLSPSSSSLYQQCARKWKFRYIDRLPDPAGEPALVGTFAHLVLEHLLQLPSGRRTQDAAKKLARTHWREIETEPEYQALALSPDQSRAFRWKAWEAIAGLWALENPDETEIHATEHEVQVDIQGVPFRGIIDRIDVVDGSLVISDYKSGKAPPDRFRRRPLKQVLLYAAAVQASTGQRPLGARLLYLGQRTLGVRVTPQNIEEVVGELAKPGHRSAAIANRASSSPRPDRSVRGVPSWPSAPRARPKSSSATRQVRFAPMPPGSPSSTPKPAEPSAAGLPPPADHHVAAEPAQQDQGRDCGRDGRDPDEAEELVVRWGRRGCDLGAIETIVARARNEFGSTSQTVLPGARIDQPR